MSLLQSKTTKKRSKFFNAPLAVAVAGTFLILLTLYRNVSLNDDIGHISSATEDSKYGRREFLQKDALHAASSINANPHINVDRDLIAHDRQQRQQQQTEDLDHLQDDDGDVDVVGDDDNNNNDPMQLALNTPPFVRGPTFARNTPFLEAIATCIDLRCVRDAHRLKRDPGIYPFPHFIIIGFQKAATTSLYSHLVGHPNLLKPELKEPEFFTFKCNWRPPYQCPANETENYIVNTLRLEEYVSYNGTRGVFESSTHIVRAGDRIAPRLIKFLPWLKIIISLRDPISRAMSMLVHLNDVGQENCLALHPMDWCLVYDSQINGSLSGALTTTYADPIQNWFEFWPAEQVHIIQYEELIDEKYEAAELVRVKEFLEIRTNAPRGGLDLHNARRFSIRPEGWKMRRHLYQQAIDIVKPDVEALLDVLEKYGKVKSRHEWLERWQKVWDDNLASCDENGDCNVLLS